jgi:hypothetical protein
MDVQLHPIGLMHSDVREPAWAAEIMKDYW